MAGMTLLTALWLFALKLVAARLIRRIPFLFRLDDPFILQWSRHMPFIWVIRSFPLLSQFPLYC